MAFNENEHYNIPNGRLRVSKNFFINSECLFIEFNDVLQLPMFRFLQIMLQNEKLNDLFILDYLKGMNEEELLLWYFNRRYINPLKELERIEFGNDQLDHFLYSNIDKSGADFLFSLDPDAFSMKAFVDKIVREKMSTKIKVYFPVYNQYIKAFIMNNWEDHVEFVFGDFKSSLTDVPQDTTFVFSDLTKINTLIETDHINFSSIAFPYEYAYNRNEKEKRFIVDCESLQKKYLFKICAFNAIREMEDEKSS